jgi:hypothetical protein
MFAWVDFHEYRDIPTKDYRRCCAVHIYQKYIKEDAVMALGFLSDKVSIYLSLRALSSSSRHVTLTHLFETE